MVKHSETICRPCRSSDNSAVFFKGEVCLLNLANGEEQLWFCDYIHWLQSISCISHLFLISYEKLTGIFLNQKFHSSGLPQNSRPRSSKIRWLFAECLARLKHLIFELKIEYKRINNVDLVRHFSWHSPKAGRRAAKKHENCAYFIKRQYQNMKNAVAMAKT